VSPPLEGAKRPGPIRQIVANRAQSDTLVDGVGVPLAVRHTAANVHDSRMLEELVDAVMPIRSPKGSPGRPRKRPEKLHADKGYDFLRCREALRQRGIKARISRRGIDTSERLGRHRWIVERTLAWLGRYRRLKVRYEREPTSTKRSSVLGARWSAGTFYNGFVRRTKSDSCYFVATPLATP
jgi:transposase